MNRQHKVSVGCIVALTAILALAACSAATDGAKPEEMESNEIALAVGAGKLSLDVGESVQIHAAVTTTGARLYTLAFTSANPNIVSVSTDGLVKAVASGSATINLVAKLLDTGGTATASVNVTVASTTPAPAPTPTTPAPPPPKPPTGVTWMYLDGAKTLAGDFTGSGESTNYLNATTSGFNGGTKDILITSSVPWGYFIPYWATNYNLPNPGYKNLLLSLKPSISGDTFGIHAEKSGDVDPNCHIELMKYGPPAVKGVWGSYVIPLADLCISGDKTLYKIVLATHTAAADSWELDAIGFQ